MTATMVGMTDAPFTWEEAARDAADTVADDLCTTMYRTRLEEIVAFIEEIKRRGTDDDGGLLEYIADDALHMYCLNDGGPEISRQYAVDTLLATLAAKQHDYGHGNIVWGGMDGVLLRMHDKCARIANLQARAAGPDIGDVLAHNESLADSWLDIAGYAIIAMMLRAGTFTLPLEADLVKVSDFTDLDGVTFDADRNTALFTTEQGHKTQVTADTLGIHLASCARFQDINDQHGPWLDEGGFVTYVKLLLGAGVQSFGWKNAGFYIDEAIA